MSKIAPWYRKEMDEKKWSPPDPVITILMCAVLVRRSQDSQCYPETPNLKKKLFLPALEQKA